MPILNCAEWDATLADFPNAHLLQTSAWGELKASFGWEVTRLVQDNCAAQILFRRLPLGFSVAYLPKGPLGDGWARFWPAVDQVCRQKRAIFLKVEPDCWETTNPIDGLMPGFRNEARPIQPRRTIVVDLTGGESVWLARMSKKTRACFRAAQRGGVRAYSSQDVNAFYQLMAETGRRDGFFVHSRAYYQTVFAAFAARGAVNLILAEWQGRLLAGLMVFAHGQRAWYLYAASRDEQRQLNPTYLCQLEAMRWAAARGCATYDLYGVPDEDEATLEEQFEARHDGLWGVYGFKRKFGGQLMRSVGAWDKVYIAGLYRLYHWWSTRRGAE